MGLIIALLFLPTALFLFGNILASIIHIKSANISKLSLSVLFGLFLALVFFFLLKVSGQVYIFSFIINIMIVALASLLLSTFLFFKKEAKKKERAIQIVSGVFTMLLGLFLSFTISGNTDFFHY